MLCLHLVTTDSVLPIFITLVAGRSTGLLQNDFWDELESKMDDTFADLPMGKCAASFRIRSQCRLQVEINLIIILVRHLFNQFEYSFKSSQVNNN